MYILLFSLFPLCFSQETLQNAKCNHWMDPGTCEAADRQQFTVQWYYDRYDHRCRKFYYGGCGGNENRFNSLEECSSQCHFQEATVYERCAQPHDPGTCESDIERWFFDMNKKQCVCSWWTGCGGNSNRYYSYNHCMEICGEYAEHGPGIDENYWGKLNGSSMSLESQSVFANYAPLPYPEQAQYQRNSAEENRRSPVYHPPYNYNSAEQHQLHVPTQQTYSYYTSAEEHTKTPQQPNSVPYRPNHSDRSGEQRTAAISWAEFHGYGSQENNGIAELKKGDEGFEPKKENIENRAYGQRIHRQRITLNPNEMSAGRQYTVVQTTGFPNVTIGMRNNQNGYRSGNVNPYSGGGNYAHHYSTAARPARPTPFYKTYFTDNKGNQIFPERRNKNTEVGPRTFVKTYEQKIPTRTLVPMEELNSPPRTQIMASYNSDQLGRRLDSKKVTWTGYGPIPIDSLPHGYRQWAHDFMQKINNGQFYTVNQQNLNRQQWRQPATAPPFVPAVPAQPALKRPVPPQAPPTYPPTVPQPTRPVYRPTPAATRPPVPPTQRPTNPVQIQPTMVARPTPPRAQPTYPPALRPTTQAPPTAPPTHRPTVPPRATVPPTRIAATYPPTVPPTRITYPPTIPPTVYYPTYRPTVHEIYVERVQDASTRGPTMRVPAQPIEYYKPQIEKLTPATLSIEDIIALDAQSDYEEDEMPLDEPQQNEQKTQAPPTLPPRSAPPTRRPTERREPERREPGWNPIVMPPEENKKKSSEQDFDFEIQSYGDAI